MVLVHVSARQVDVDHGYAYVAMAHDPLERHQPAPVGAVEGPEGVAQGVGSVFPATNARPPEKPEIYLLNPFRGHGSLGANPDMLLSVCFDP